MLELTPLYDRQFHKMDTVLVPGRTFFGNFFVSKLSVQATHISKIWTVGAMPELTQQFQAKLE